MSALGDEPPALAATRRQRTHILLMFGDRPPAVSDVAMGGAEPAGLLSKHHYVRHNLDITGGHHPPPPGRFLTLCHLAIDGAEAAVAAANALAAAQAAATGDEPLACWLYYPASERVGIDPRSGNGMITLALANGKPGEETSFLEWYATRHIRHALNIPALVNGQCFRRCLAQPASTLAADYLVAAIYEQESGPEAIIAACEDLAPDTFAFPMLDTLRFAEAVYQPAA